jgi:hypothetical protein
VCCNLLAAVTGVAVVVTAGAAGGGGGGGRGLGGVHRQVLFKMTVTFLENITKSEHKIPILNSSFYIG